VYVYVAVKMSVIVPKPVTVCTPVLVPVPVSVLVWTLESVGPALMMRPPQPTISNRTVEPSSNRPISLSRVLDMIKSMPELKLYEM